MINVDSIFNEHFPDAFKNKKLLSRPVRGFLKTLFHESEFQQFEKDYPNLQGFDFIEQVLNYFDFSYSVRSQDIYRIPATGRVIIIANHPIGSLDGLALLKLIGEVRRDVKAIANELLMAIEPLHPLLLPVDNMGNKTRRDNIKAIDEHLNNEGAVIIFPAGEVSRMSPKGIQDGSWNSGFLKFANKTSSPILPIHINARNSFLFYSLSLLAKPLSTLLLVREMFLQASNNVHMRIGTTIPPESWQQLGTSTQAQTKLFKKHLYRVGKNKSPILKISPDTIAHPEHRQLIRQEIRQCEQLGETPDGKKIVLYRSKPDSTIMREIGRLREIAFRKVGEGSGKRRDIDHYDNVYDHVILWDDDDLEIAGAYRMAQTHNNNNTLYSDTLFQYSDDFHAIRSQGLELGRSFVQPRYWGMRSLDYLWHGIAAYIKRYPHIRYLFGPVSISAAYPSTARDLIILFYQQHYASTKAYATANIPHRIAEDNQQLYRELFPGNDSKEDFTILKQTLTEMGYSVPTLYKQYTELCEPGGAQFSAFNVDPDFNYCIDGLVIVDIDKLKPSKHKRYLGDWQRAD